MKLRINHPAIGDITVPLEPHGIVVGREGGYADLEMNWDRRVSRRHVRFWVEGGEVWFEDLGSKNGVWEGSTRLEGPQHLEDDHLILVGESMFSVARDMGGEAVATVDMNLEKIDEVVPEENMFATDTVTGVCLDVDMPKQRAYRAPEIVIEDVPPAPLGIPPAETEPLAESAPTIPAAEAPKAAPPPAPAAESRPAPKDSFTRADPRFLAEKKVAVRIGERAELRTLWTENISRGGLFVRTETPPQRGTVVEVMINTPDGDLVLTAEVVHVVDISVARATNQSAGVGLQFVHLAADQKEAIHRYVDGLAERIDSVRSPGSSPGMAPLARESIEKTLSRARDFIAKVEDNDLYRALGVASKANVEELQNAINELRRLFNAAVAHATPPQLARLNGALKLLDRAGSLMTHPERRMEYDFRRGDIRAEERVQAAKLKKGPPLSELRGIYHRALPDRLGKALALVREAVVAKKARNLAEAVRLGRAALELDPFHDELRQTVDAWSKMAGSAD